jgi:hypothetical protein
VAFPVRAVTQGKRRDVGTPSAPVLYFIPNAKIKGGIPIMHKRIAFALCLAIALAIGGAAQAKRVLDENLDLKTLQKMAEMGQVIHLEYKGNTLVNRMVCVVINAPLDKVWNAITDFKNYHKIITSMLPPVVTKKSDKEYKVDFTVDVKIAGPIKSTNKYSMLYVLEKPMLYMYDPAKPKGLKQNAGYWKLVSIEGGKKTLVFYLDAAPDLNMLGSLVVNFVKEKPELGLALQVSPVSIMMQGFKNYIENKKK